MDSQRNSYDEVPYPSGAFPGTHPSHLAMVSTLCGLNPPSPQSCRVLELGCAFGANLIPMAESLPGSEFLGIDLSGSQVEQGNAEIDRLGLRNIKLKHLSITDVDASLGKFDYIICHGVFSWVPLHVRQAILKIGAEHLTPRGVHYVSYNTYPGWHLRGVVRDMMKYHVQQFKTPQEKVAQARALLKFLAEYSQSHFKAYESILKQEVESLESRGDYYIYHEHLEEINEPLYFHEFVSEAEAAGLRYVADTNFSTMVAQMFDNSVVELLKDVPLLRREQYMDFLRSRAFRCSVLCHAAVPDDYSMNPTYLRSLHVRFTRPGRRDEKLNDKGQVRWTFGTGEMTTAEPITQMMQQLTDAYPAWMPVADLVAGTLDAELERKMLECFQVGFVRGLFHLSTEPPQFAARLSERPECRRLARLQATNGPRVTNWLHHDIGLPPQQQLLVRHMDGSRNREDLARILAQAVEQGQIRIHSSTGDMPRVDLAFFGQVVDAELAKMIHFCLFNR